MATALARIFKTANPAGWTYTFDNTSTPDATVDAVGSVASATLALDAIKPLIAALPGVLSGLTINVNTFE